MPAQMDTEDAAHTGAREAARVVLAKHPCVVPGGAAPERVRRAEPVESSSAPAVYVFRLPEPSRRFTWEIRKLSAIVVERSREDFANVDDARSAGWAALTALTANT